MTRIVVETISTEFEELDETGLYLNRNLKLTGTIDGAAFERTWWQFRDGEERDWPHGPALERAFYDACCLAHAGIKSSPPSRTP